MPIDLDAVPTRDVIPQDLKDVPMLHSDDRSGAVVVVGCGGIGSNFAHLFARKMHEQHWGLEAFEQLFAKKNTKACMQEFPEKNLKPQWATLPQKLYLVDFDEVELKNLTRQMFTKEDVGRLKCEALADAIADVQVPDLEVVPITAQLETDQQVESFAKALGLPNSSAVTWIVATDNLESKLLIGKYADANGQNYLIGNCDGNHYEVKNWLDSKETKAISLLDEGEAAQPATGNRYLNLQNTMVNSFTAWRLNHYYFTNSRYDFGTEGRAIKFSETGDIAPGVPKITRKVE